LPVNGVTHKVKSGDTILRLANTYQAESDNIKAFNKLDEVGTLTIGATLVIPEGTQPRPAPSTTIVRNTRAAPTTNIFQPTSQPQSPEAGSQNLIWPTSGRVITQYWGWRHTGVDIDDDRPGAPVYASARGRVELAGWGGGYGIQVVLVHLDANGNPTGVKTRYAHLSALYVVPGQIVSQGHVLGPVGTTGYSTGTHLHFEVYVNGVRRNPLLYVR
jgi:murein DD-endopeptidase MepM/ murein hydrolase activator NlpD